MKTIVTLTVLVSILVVDPVVVNSNPVGPLGMRPVGGNQHSVSYVVLGQNPAPARTLKSERGYSGRIFQLGNDWLELEPGWQASTRPKGLIPPDEPSTTRRFASDLVANSYHLDDLKPGDEVRLIVGATRDGIEYCQEIRIYRRPGGKIPPFPGDLFPERATAVHLQYQAEQDWEEYGLPITVLFLASGRSTRLQRPPPAAAPQPREAKP